MFDNEPTNPKLIVANILSLSDSWKELLTEEKQPTAQKSKARRAPAKRKTKSS